MSFLEQLTIATPCPASWNEMTGDERIRFCDLCQKNVYNLSSMTHKEATQLIQEKEGRLCIRVFRRADGTVLTQDCSVGLQKRFGRKVRYKRQGIAAIITLVAITGINSLNAYAQINEPLPPSPQSSLMRDRTTPIKKPEQANPNINKMPEDPNDPAENRDTELGFYEKPDTKQPIKL